MNSDDEYKPSRKALGKRRAVVDEDSELSLYDDADKDHFDPDDMFKDKKDSSHSSEEDCVTADEVYLSKPVVYAYDAYQERLEAQKAAEASANSAMSLPKLGGGSRG